MPTVPPWLTDIATANAAPRSVFYAYAVDEIRCSSPFSLLNAKHVRVPPGGLGLPERGRLESLRPNSLSAVSEIYFRQDTPPHYTVMTEYAFS